MQNLTIPAYMRSMAPFNLKELRVFAKSSAWDIKREVLRPFSCRLTVRGGEEWRTEYITIYDFNIEDMSPLFMDAEKYSDLADERKLRAVFHEMINLSTYSELRSMYELSTGTSFEATL